MTTESRSRLNEEIEKADVYLRSLGLLDAKRRLEILHSLVSASPDGKVMQQLFLNLEEWTSAQHGLPKQEAILAAWLARSFETAPDQFLSQSSVLPSKVSLRHGPELVLSQMTARPMDFGLLPAIARDTRKSLEWRPLLRAIIFWTLIYFAIVFGYPALS